MKDERAPTNLDALRAREMATALLKLADGLDDAASTRELRERRARAIRQVWAVFAGLAEKRRDGTERRSFLLELIEELVETARRQPAPEWLPSVSADEQEARITDEVVIRFAYNVPEMAATIIEHRAKVAALVRAKNRNRNQRRGSAKLKHHETVEGATELLCDAMGWAAESSTIGRTKQRQKATRKRRSK